MMDAPKPDPALSRRAYQHAKTLAEQLEMLGLIEEARQVRAIRGRLARM